MANLSNINGKFVVEQTTGYVGVGTTDPNFLIEAAGVNSEIALNSTSGSIYRVRSTSSDSFIITKNGVGDRLVIDGSGNSTFSGETYFNKGVRFYRYTDQANYWSVYTNTDDSLRFNYNGSGNDEITIDSSGNVGIGTTSPLALLSVGSGSLADTNVPVQISTSGGTSQRWFGVNKDGSYGLLMGYLNGGSIGDGGAGAYIRNITEDPLYFMVSNSDLAMTILANKNVGIGAESPVGKLQVSLPAYTNEDTNSQQAIFGVDSGYGVRIGYNETDNKGYINVLKPGVAWGSLILQEDVGKVGIGETNPAHKLSIKATDDTRGILVNNTLTTSYAEVALKASREFRMGTGNSASATDARDRWYVYDATAGTHRLTLDSLGNFGIGTTSPQTKLEVNGGLVKIVENSNTAFYGGDYVRVFGTQSYGFRNSSGSAIAQISLTGNSYFNGGNVGIGTTSPSYRLQIGIAGSLIDSIRIGSYAVAKNTRQYIGYTRADSGLFEESGDGDTPSTVLSGVAGIRIVNTTGTITSSKADNSVQLLTHIYNGGSRVALHASYNGNVGIGVTGPVTKLHVSNTAVINDAYGLALVENTSTGSGSAANSALNIKSKYGTSQFMQWENQGLRIGSRILDNSSVGDVYFTAGADSVKMVVKAGGNVGIGVTSPIAQLDVAGNTNQHHSVSTSNNGTWRSMINLGTVGWLDQASSAGRVKIYGSENGNTNVSYCEYYVLRSGSGYHIQQIGTRLDVGNTHGQIEARISGNFLQVKNVANSSLGTARAVLSAMKN